VIRHADHVSHSILKSWQSLRRQAAVARSVEFARGLRPWSFFFPYSSKEIGQEISVENVGQNRDVKIAKRTFENVSQFKCLWTTVTNQNLIQEEMKRRLNSGNACYNSVQNLLPSCLRSGTGKINCD
jgi:hypothetical protein